LKAFTFLYQTINILIPFISLLKVTPKCLGVSTGAIETPPKSKAKSGFIFFNLVLNIIISVLFRLKLNSHFSDQSFKLSRSVYIIFINFLNLLHPGQIGQLKCHLQNVFQTQLYHLLCHNAIDIKTITFPTLNHEAYWLLNRLIKAMLFCLDFFSEV
jgi:hypothetical protein